MKICKYTYITAADILRTGNILEKSYRKGVTTLSINVFFRCALKLNCVLKHNKLYQ